MTMEKNDKNSNIERLLQAVETPERFNDEQLADIMNNEETQELYSLLSNIETIIEVDNARLPDVEVEWSNFARWRRKNRIMRRGVHRRRVNNWPAFVSIAAVLIFVLFIISPFLAGSTNDPVAAPGAVQETELTNLCIGDKKVDTIGYNRCIVHNPYYRAAHRRIDNSLNLFGKYDFYKRGARVISLSQQTIEQLFGCFDNFDNFEPYTIDTELFLPTKFTPFENFSTPIHTWPQFNEIITFDW